MSANPQQNTGNSAPPLPSLLNRELTLKQKLFCEAYCGQARGNATEAARLANYEGNDVTLGAVGAENLRKPQIKKWINERFEATAMQSGEILNELSDIAKADWRDLLTIITDKEGNTVSAKLNLGDKVKALDLMAKIRRLMPAKELHVSGEITLKTEQMLDIKHRFQQVLSSAGENRLACAEAFIELFESEDGVFLERMELAG